MSSANWAGETVSGMFCEISLFSIMTQQSSIFHISFRLAADGSAGWRLGPEITKLGPSSAEVRESHLDERLTDRFLAGIIRPGPKKVTTRLCCFAPTEHLALSLWEEGYNVPHASCISKQLLWRTPHMGLCAVAESSGKDRLCTSISKLQRLQGMNAGWKKSLM